MTLIITMLNKKGVWLASDTWVTKKVNEKNVLSRYVEKTIPINKKTAISFWTDSMKINGKSIENHLRKKKRSLKSKNINEIGFFLKHYFEKLNIEKDTGFHIAGFIDEKPKLFHLFHTKNLEKGEFILEDTHKCIHNLMKDPFGRTVFGRIFRQKEEPYTILFNGDFRTTTLIVNGLRQFHEQSGIKYELLNEDDSRNFLLQMMDIAINIQKLSEPTRSKGAIIGYPLKITNLSDSGIKEFFIKKVKSFSESKRVKCVKSFKTAIK